MKPFLKWAGGKRWLVAKFAHNLPDFHGKYVEPFLGSGAVFFSYEPAESILTDSNIDLIDTYSGIKADPNQVMELLREHSNRHSDDYYYEVRGSKPKDLFKKAARFIYLNRTCFNGIYRVNRLGNFNVPKGSRDKVIFDNDDFINVSRLLQKSQLKAQDFEETLALCSREDLIYIDPPYTVKHNKNAFVKYNEKIFSWEDQMRLAALIREMSQSGFNIVVSNANHPEVIKLYSDRSLKITQVPRASSIASSPEKRSQTTELLIYSERAQELQHRSVDIR